MFKDAFQRLSRCNICVCCGCLPEARNRSCSAGVPYVPYYDTESLGKQSKTVCGWENILELTYLYIERETA